MPAFRARARWWPRNLDSIGVTELDYVVCTHAHEDHCGGLDYILENYPVGTLFCDLHGV